MSTFRDLFNAKVNKESKSQVSNVSVNNADFKGFKNGMINSYRWTPIEYFINALETLLDLRDNVSTSPKNEFTRKELKVIQNWYTRKVEDDYYDHLWANNNSLHLTPTRIEKFVAFKDNDTGKDVCANRYYYSKDSILTFIDNCIKHLKTHNSLSEQKKYADYELKQLQEKCSNIEKVQYVLEHC